MSDMFDDDSGIFCVWSEYNCKVSKESEVIYNAGSSKLADYSASG